MAQSPLMRSVAAVPAELSTKAQQRAWRQLQARVRREHRSGFADRFPQLATAFVAWEKWMIMHHVEARTAMTRIAIGVAREAYRDAVTDVGRVEALCQRRFSAALHDPTDPALARLARSWRTEHSVRDDIIGRAVPMVSYLADHVGAQPEPEGRTAASTAGREAGWAASVTQIAASLAAFTGVVTAAPSSARTERPRRQQQRSVRDTQAER